MRTARSLTVSRRIRCTPPEPCMPPSNHTHPPQPHMPPGNHACPLATMQPLQPCIPPTTMHAPTTTHAPQPHMPPNHACPPTTMHAFPATTHATPCNHTCPLATMHALPQPHTPCNHACPLQPCMPPATTCPPQPCMPPCNHTHPPITMHAPGNHASLVNRMTNRCKNITCPKLRLRAVTSMHSSRMCTPASVATTRCKYWDWVLCPGGFSVWGSLSEV